MTQRPIIGITASKDQGARRYKEAVEKAGGSTLILSPDTFDSVNAALAGITGLLVSGGPDIDPTLYGEAQDPEANLEILRSRDDLELPLLRAALNMDMPVLAICRGMQALNVVMEGRLIQDLPGHKAENKDGEGESAYHRIYISPGSKLAAILGSGGFVRVNSRHHQGLREAQKSPMLLASAYSLDDGLIEGLESPQHSWVIGVQWHPELENEVPRQFQNLFLGHVERAEMYSKVKV